MTYPEAVDQDAPIVTEHTVAIDAPRELVWQIHLDVNRWTTWSPDITEATSPAPLAPGVTFHWSSYGFGVDSTVYAVEPPHTIRWGGTASGITGIHQWWFDETTPGRTHVTTRESWSGDPVVAELDRSRHDLDHSLDAWLTALRAEAERQARAAGPV